MVAEPPRFEWLLHEAIRKIVAGLSDREGREITIEELATKHLDIAPGTLKNAQKRRGNLKVGAAIAIDKVATLADLGLSLNVINLDERDELIYAWLRREADQPKTPNIRTYLDWIERRHGYPRGKGWPAERRALINDRLAAELGRKKRPR